VAVVCIAIIQTYAVSDPDIISIDRKLRIFASLVFILLAFIPIVVVALVLVLSGTRTSPPAEAEEKGSVDESAISTVQNSRTTSFDRTTVDHHASLPEKKVESENVPTKNPHIPKTGYGSTPVTRRELLENAAAIVVPAILLTIEQGIRVAQVYYLPRGVEELPWVRTLCNYMQYFITSPIVHEQSCILDHNLRLGINHHYNLRCGVTTQALHAPEDLLETEPPDGRTQFNTRPIGYRSESQS
jgi:hypothetical protein